MKTFAACVHVMGFIQVEVEAENVADAKARIARLDLGNEKVTSIMIDGYETEPAPIDDDDDP